MKSMSKRQRRAACLSYILKARGITRISAPVLPVPEIHPEPAPEIKPSDCSQAQQSTKQ